VLAESRKPVLPDKLHVGGSLAAAAEDAGHTVAHFVATSPDTIIPLPPLAIVAHLGSGQPIN